jgi:hypothetical protein
MTIEELIKALKGFGQGNEVVIDIDGIPYPVKDYIQGQRTTVDGELRHTVALFAGKWPGEETPERFLGYHEIGHAIPTK